VRGLALRPRPRPSGLRLLVLSISARCDQRCAHCQIWMGNGAGVELSLAERLAIVDDAIAGGVEEALITGGEPLLSPHLGPVARRLRTGGIRLMLATNGMLLARHAVEVGALFAEVYVSLDGASAVTHDGVRGVAALERLAGGVAALRRSAPEVHVVARSTLHAANLDEFEAIIGAARAMGFDHVSFLPLDASSEAFGGDPGARRALVPGFPQVHAFEATVDRLEAAGVLRDGFVLENASKLRRLARHLVASAGQGDFERPPCDAPWWSSVVDADGTLRPCFFHRGVGDARRGLDTVRSSPAFAAALAHIRGPNETCERCVCPKKRGRSLPWARA
jgi:MoaA/NifB/PqqE/SkfB family radical SAM enzyme